MRPDESDDVLKEIRAELMAVEPSPAFAAGVRARVERPQSGAPFMRWALAAAAVVTIAGGAYWLAPREDRATIAAVPVASAPVVIPYPKVDAPRASQPVAEPAKRNAVVRPVVGETATVAAAGPDLTVITDQPEAIRRLWARAAADEIRRGVPPDAVAEITVPPVVVDPIVIPGIGEGGRGGLGPVIRRTPQNRAVNGDNATRSER